MDTEETVIDETSQWETIECLHELLIDSLVVLDHCFSHEIVTVRHAPGLMIASEQEHFFGVIYFQCHYEGHHLHRVGSSIYVISKEENVTIELFLDVSNLGQHFEEIVILPMNIPHDCGWSFNAHEIGLVLLVKIVILMKLTNFLIISIMVSSSNTPSSCKWVLSWIKLYVPFCLNNFFLSIYLAERYCLCIGLDIIIVINADTL